MEMSMTWQRAMQQAHQGIVLGLECMRQLMEQLGNPQNQVKSIHIAGTNGKGSVLAMTTSVLVQAGYHTGTYSSPCLFDKREQYQVDGKWLLPSDLDWAMEHVLAAGKQVKIQNGRFPTVFELETAVAFVLFAKYHCDVMVIECGMGGDEDATNVMSQKVCSVLTSISLDHTKFLGSTLEEIAAHKAGIIMEGMPVVLYEQSDAVMRCVQDFAQRLHAPLSIAKGSEVQFSPTKRGLCMSYQGITLHLPFLGIYQVYNAAVVLELWQVLCRQGFVIGHEDFVRGMEQAHWQGRMELLWENPVLLADGAHNPDGARMLAQSLRLYLQQNRNLEKIIFIIGIFKDKEYREILQILLPLAERVYTVASDNPRALAADQLKEVIHELQPDLTVEAKDSVAAALAEAKKCAGQDGMICACGSLSFMKELYDAANSCAAKFVKICDGSSEG